MQYCDTSMSRLILRSTAANAGVWCEFLTEHNFLVGLSIDGPKELHDYYRRDKAGEGSFDRIFNSARLLREHGTTFGGNPIASAAANAALNVLVEERLAERAAEMGAYFMKKLKQLKEKYKIIRDIRGKGLMVGVELRFDCRDILLGAMERGILILSAGRNVLRFLPPLVIKEEHIDYIINTLDVLFQEQETNWMKK